MTSGCANTDDRGIGVDVGNGGICAEVDAASPTVSDASVAEWYSRRRWGGGERRWRREWCMTRRWSWGKRRGGRRWATRRD